MADDLEKASQKPQIDAPEEPKEYVDTQFQPIDARHLSSLPLVRARIVKLLKASKNNMHASNNLILAIVCLAFSSHCDIRTDWYANIGIP